MTVTLVELQAAVEAQQAAVSAEDAAFIAACLAGNLLKQPRSLGLADVVVTGQGELCVLSGQASSGEEAEASVRAVLSRLLGCALRPNPRLGALAAQPQPSLEGLLGRLEAALVPLNRAAARRSLARLCRAVERARDVGLLAAPSSPPSRAAVTPPPVNVERIPLAPAPTTHAEAVGQLARRRRTAPPVSEQLTVPQPVVRRTLGRRPSPQRSAEHTPLLGSLMVTEPRLERTNPLLFGSSELYESVAPHEVELLESAPPPRVERSRVAELVERFSRGLLRSDQQVRHDLKGLAGVEHTPGTPRAQLSQTPPPVFARIEATRAPGPERTPLGGFVVASLGLVAVLGFGWLERASLSAPSVSFGSSSAAWEASVLPPSAAPAPAEAPGAGSDGTECQAVLEVGGLAEGAQFEVRSADRNVLLPDTASEEMRGERRVPCAQAIEVLIRPAAGGPLRRIPVSAEALVPSASGPARVRIQAQ